jgi:hypothetical protein
MMTRDLVWITAKSLTAVLEALVGSALVFGLGFCLGPDLLLANFLVGLILIPFGAIPGAVSGWLGLRRIEAGPSIQATPKFNLGHQGLKQAGTK